MVVLALVLLLLVSANRITATNLIESSGKMDGFRFGCTQILPPQLLSRTNTFRNLTWPGGRVVYEFEPSFPAEGIKVFYSVIKQFHEYTCLRFWPKTEKDNAYILIQGTDQYNNSCGAAAICRAGTPAQYFKLFYGCTSFKTIWAHELGHSVCLIHEYSRLDRNDYLTFDQCPDQGSHAEIVPGQDDLGTLYDYTSVMSYPCNDLYKCNGLPSMKGVTKCGYDAQSDGLSTLDIDKLNLIYNCQCKKTH